MKVSVLSSREETFPPACDADEGMDGGRGASQRSRRLSPYLLDDAAGQTIGLLQHRLEQVLGLDDLLVVLLGDLWGLEGHHRFGTSHGQRLG